MDEKTGSFRHDNMEAPKSDKVMPLFSLKGRTAIVSGAGAGIGLAVAHAFAEAGANVAIWYNSNKQALDEAKKIEKEYGVRCKLPFALESYSQPSRCLNMELVLTLNRQSVPSQQCLLQGRGESHQRDRGRVQRPT